ncbi:uncharacterized protein LOC133700099 [Populus nigra]|uniref:uncharacterized protein LOC133700099 n=1 Tax=Populus nigra TaxID=3691 RepID=UPI002B274F8F|nr:uncharacterized protein LOC133700099 [Populus nigra]
MASVVLVKEAIFSQDSANGLEFRSATPDERSDGRSRKWNQRALLQIKDFLASESWKEARQVLRRCSSNLKLDLYALEYAAREKNVSFVWQCYEGIVTAYDDMLSRI